MGSASSSQLRGLRSLLIKMKRLRIELGSECLEAYLLCQDLLTDPLLDLIPNRNRPRARPRPRILLGRNENIKDREPLSRPSNPHLASKAGAFAYAIRFVSDAPSRFTLRTRDEWSGQVDCFGQPFLGAEFQEPVALHLG
jgi:hypothetical protein